MPRSPPSVGHGRRIPLAHLLAAHKKGAYVRAVAASSSLDLALLSSYRTALASDDGVFLRFGALDVPSLRAGTAALAEAAHA